MGSMLTHCSAVLSHNNALFSVFFLTGLTGGFTHCLSMCGSIVASQAASCQKDCAGACSKKAQAGNATQLSYHLGRATTYGALGFLAASVSQQLNAFPFWPWLSAIMLLAAGAMFIGSSLSNCKHPFFQPMAKFTYAKGALLGFMPCGLLYAALMMAATTASPWRGMVGMWLFVAGTLPALLIASVGTALIAQKWQAALQKAGRVMLAFNGLSLFVMAGQLVRI